MNQLPTKRQMYWILAIAGVLTALSAGGSIALAAGYFTGQVVILTALVVIVKALRTGASRLKGRAQQEN